MTVSPSKKQFLLRIEATTLEKLRKLAAGQDESLNKFICDLLDKHVWKTKPTSVLKRKGKPWWI